MILEHTLTIQADIEDVYSYFVDINHLEEWIGGLLEVEVLGDGILKQGAQSKQVIEQNGMKIHFKQTVSVYEPPLTFKVDLVSKEMDIVSSYDFSAVDGGTQIKVHQAVKLKKFILKAAKKIVRGIMETTIKEDMNRLKHNIEHG